MLIKIAKSSFNPDNKEEMEAAAFIYNKVYPELVGKTNYSSKNNTVIIPLDIVFDSYDQFYVFTPNNRAWMVVYLLNYTDKYIRIAEWMDKPENKEKKVPSRPKKADYDEAKANKDANPDAFAEIEERMELHRAKWVDAMKGSMKNGSWEEEGLLKLQAVTKEITDHFNKHEDAMDKVEKKMLKKLKEMEAEASKDENGNPKPKSKKPKKVTVLRDDTYAGGLTDSEDEKEAKKKRK